MKDIEKVIKQAKRGNKAAHDKLMENFYAFTVKAAGEVLRDPEDAMNIAVEFWRKMRKENLLKKFNMKSTFVWWASRCIKNLALNHLQKKRVTVYYNTEWDKELEFSDVDRIAGIDQLNEVMDTLTHREQDVLWRMLEGMNVKEIAKDFQISISRTRAYVGRVRNRIKDIIGAE